MIQKLISSRPMITYSTIALYARIPLVQLKNCGKRRGNKFGVGKRVCRMHWSKCWLNITIRLCTWQLYIGWIYILKYLLFKGHTAEGCWPCQRGRMCFHRREKPGQLLQGYLQNNNIQFKSLINFLMYSLLILYRDINIQVEVSSIAHYSGLRPFCFNFYLKKRTTAITNFGPFFQLPI